MNEPIELYKKVKGKFVKVPMPTVIEIVNNYKQRKDQEMRKETWVGFEINGLPPSISK